ncbi:hypothetical protein A9404_02995 [Halothiobacillus diazotrophicus]|uniref:Uncharacterized protein n=1 Tax=Halothiobacillus diazotrophicus TaxID=1860122 RepID=A0A191ZF43_9GAMM|nr:DUF6231 family protein [Halothiobacillus diazotrophicus]ANJ66482.1 hypothetical protein A9404_02995 [Halothiobacillus diazotrophicus]
MSEHQTITLLNATPEEIKTLASLAAALDFPTDVVTDSGAPMTEKFALGRITESRISGAQVNPIPVVDETLSSEQTEILNPAVRILGLQIDVSEALSTDVYQWVARIRNQGAIRVVVIPATTSNDNLLLGHMNPAWTAQLIALGFLRKHLGRGNPVNAADHPSWVLYFDIHQYKETPDWLNARHWANPQNWNKFRW